MAFMRTNKIRMQAISATFAHLPRSRNAWYRSLKAG
jgi:hypothetical protein